MVFTKSHIDIVGFINNPHICSGFTNNPHIDKMGLKITPICT